MNRISCNQNDIYKLSLTAAFLFSSKLGFADPPFVTDDPETVGLSTWEVNYAVSKTRISGGHSAGIPTIDINYGFSENLQIHAQPKYGYESDTQGKFSAIDNTEIGVKYRILIAKNGSANWMVATYPLIQLPTGDNDLGDNRREIQAFLPLWVQCDYEKWTIYGGIGHRLNQYSDSKNSWFSGLATLYKLTSQLQLGAEVFLETETVNREKGASAFNIGGIYNLSNNYHLLWSIGKGLSNVSNTNLFSGYLALQVIY